MPEKTKAFEKAMTLAALSGLKIALGPAFLKTRQNSPTARNWVLGALGEMVLDKVGVFPARFRPMLLIPHTLAGAWVARESMIEDGEDGNTGAALGAIVAAGVASVAPMVRIVGSKGLGIPDALLGIAEDYLALKLGSQAMGMTLDQVADAAKESVGEVQEALKPAMEKVGVGF